MSENMDRSIEPLAFPNYSPEDLYHIKPVDRDSGKQSKERFEEHLQQKETDSDNQNDDKHNASLKDLETPEHLISDDISLSESALKAQTSGDNVIQQIDNAEVVKEADKAKHIDVTA